MTGTRAARSSIALVVTLVMVVGLLAAACGGSSDGGSDTGDGGSDTGNEAHQDETTPEATGGSNSTSIEVEARDNVFSVQPSQGAAGTIEAPANTEITVKVVNEGALPHNIAFYTEEGGSLVDEDAIGDLILEAESDAVTFTTPGPGTYFFVCTVHPQEMFGDFIVN